MGDPRDREYAELLVGTCVDVQSGWRVLVLGGILGRPLIHEIVGAIARRDAYATLVLSLDGSAGMAGGGIDWLREAPLERVATATPFEEHMIRECDALIGVHAPENTRSQAAVADERHAATRAAFRPANERVMAHAVPWVACQYPTDALAQDAGMSSSEFADFLFGACLLDWDVERERMSRYAERFERSEEIRIVGPDTDLTLTLGGRPLRVDAGAANMPGGEFFGAPVEESANGVISFELPTRYLGRDVSGIRLRFEDGAVVDASADLNEEFFIQQLDLDGGSRRLGELGIGCNPGITRYLNNTLFDEKMDGTVHLALGNSYTDLGGTNVSAIHWDIVKDLRDNGRIELDGVTVQENGRWLV